MIKFKKLKNCTYNQLYNYQMNTEKRLNKLPYALQMFLEFYPGGEGTKDANMRIKLVMEDLLPEYMDIEIGVYVLDNRQGNKKR